VKAYLALALAALAGCEKSAPPSAGGGGSAPGQAAPAGAGGDPGAGLVVTREGKPVRMTSAVALSRGGGAIEITMSTRPLDCQSAGLGMEPMDETQTQVRVVIAPLLRASGASEWAVSRTYFRGGNDDRERGAIAGGPYDASKDVSVTLPKLELHSAGKHKETVTVEGPLVAKGCGVVPGDRAAKPRPQPDVTFSVAGRTMPVLGAVIERRKSATTVLRLATHPLDCRDYGLDADLVWELYLDGDQISRAQLRGALLPSQSSQMLRATDKVVAHLGPPTTIDADYQQLDLPVRVTGPVDALVCDSP
jgi:hypothetical protein